MVGDDCSVSIITYITNTPLQNEHRYIGVGGTELDSIASDVKMTIEDD